VVQAVEHQLVALRVLYDYFRLTGDRQHFRGLRLLEPRDMGFMIPQKVGQGVDFTSIELGSPPPIN
jgi:hypothetical protein